MSIEILKKNDPAIATAIDLETHRQQDGLEMIASENYTSLAVMEAQGSVLTNKYAEGYPSKRYYGGCEFVDQIENIAIERAKHLFNCEYANVQPHSGSQANMAVYLSVLQAGDTFMGMDLSHGGHLTHGSSVNFSGILYKSISYGLDPKSNRLNYEVIRKLAIEHKPKLMIAGYSSYPRTLDFAKFREIANEVGAKLMVDMAHFAGLVAGGVHDSPVPYADFTTTTTHKTLRGPRGGMILCSSNEEAKKINKTIFPGIQGGPLEHVIAAKAVAFGEALKPEFKLYAQQIVKNAKALAEAFLSEDFDLVTGGTDNHLILVDLTRQNITGLDASKWLEMSHIAVNKNSIPNEPRSPFVTSGIRIGTPALTTRGMKESEMKIIAGWISKVLRNPEEKTFNNVAVQISELCKSFTLY